MTSQPKSLSIFDKMRIIWAKLPYPDRDCTGKIVIVIGTNVGLGKEVILYFVRLNAASVNLLVRTQNLFSLVS
jgi:hypothetical protein